jgi:hypothetical protein
MWFAAVLQLAECIDAVCRAPRGAIHVAWTEDILHLEIDELTLSDNDIDRVLGQATVLEGTTGRRVFMSSSPRRRGAA